MASIVLRAFGGMAPASNLKAVDPSTASYAKNLNLRFGDFRPCPVPASVQTGLSTGSTLYRFETTGSFITRPGTVNFVTGPIPTDTTERTYYTGDSYPKVTDNTGDIRQLGVPQPAAAPTFSVTTVNNYSTTVAAAAKGFKQAVFAGVVWDACQVVYVGMSDADLATYFAATANPWAYKFIIAGTLSGAVFTPTNANHRNLMDERLGFYLESVSGTTTGYVDMMVRGTKRVFDNTALSTALAAITDPSDPTGVAKLIDASQITLIENTLTDALKTADDTRDAAIGRMRLLKTEFVTLANTASVASASQPAAMAAFYARTEVDAQVDAAVAQAVQDIFDAMNVYNTSI